MTGFIIHTEHTMFWNSENLQLRRKKWGKQATHMVLWKGNVLEIFLLGNAEVRRTLVTFIIRREVKNTECCWK